MTDLITHFTFAFVEDRFGVLKWILFVTHTINIYSLELLASYEKLGDDKLELCTRLWCWLNDATMVKNADDLPWKPHESFHTDSIYFIKHLWSCTWNEQELPENLKGDTYPDLFTF